MAWLRCAPGPTAGPATRLVYWVLRTPYSVLRTSPPAPSASRPFPLPRDTITARARGEAAARDAGRRGGAMVPKILIVDDEPDLELLIRQRFRRQIRAGAYHFAFARNGQEALDLI